MSFHPRIRVLLALFSLLPFAPLAARECLIAENGEPHAVIVYRKERLPEVQEAVDDLRVTIRRMSGADLAVSDQPRLGHHSLILLTEADLRASGVPQPVPVDLSALRSLNEEGFLIRVREGQAWLVGRTELGLQHAVYWLLEQWGCRWLFPGEAGEVIPSAASLTVTPAMETAQQPRFLMRSIQYNFAGCVTREVREDFKRWLRFNRLQYSLTGSVGHAYGRIIPFNDRELFHRQPELFPRSWGKPVRRGQIATDHPGVRERAVRYAFDYFTQTPQASIVSMSPNDGFGPWRSDSTKHFLFTDAALDLANHVAKALKVNPQTRDKKVGMYAYLITGLPPTIRAEDNVIVFVATRLNPLPWRWLVSMWDQKVEQLGIRDYASILHWHETRPTWGLAGLKRKVDFWDRHGIVGVSVESGNDWAGWGLYHYVLARLLWNPQEEVDRIVEDYLSKGFGTAATEMGRYFKRWKLGYNAHTLKLAARDVVSALNRAESPQIRRRIEQYVLYLHHLHLLEKYRDPAIPGAPPLKATRELVAFDWRLARTNVAHTGAYVQRFIRPRALKWYRIDAREFDSWKSAAPFEPGEAEQLLLRDLEAYRN